MSETQTKIKNKTNLFHKKVYIKVPYKFLLSHIIAFSWMIFSIYVSLPWVNDLGMIVTKPVAILIIAGIGYIPGYINAFIVTSLLMDRQPRFLETSPNDEVTIIIACKNEERNIANTLRYIANQDYDGTINVIVVDNGSTDNTFYSAKAAGEELSLNIQVVL